MNAILNKYGVGASAIANATLIVELIVRLNTQFAADLIE
jgi:hypothetical protein